MAEVKNGQREYGIVHVVEEEMRKEGVGVFAQKGRTVASDKTEVEDAPKAPARKAKAK